MQVRKFEAKTMKEALELVKRHMGPEAIILSAKDNSRGFGLGGQKSVEVTAAVSEETLRKKMIAESKLSSTLKPKFEQVPARVQRSFIDKATTHRSEMPVVRPAQLRYVDILDDEQHSHGEEARPTAGRVDSIENLNDRDLAQQNVKSAAQRAWQAMNEANVVATPRAPAPKAVAVAARPQREASEIRDLKAEILQLKNLVENFQRVPQNFVSLHPGADQGISFDLSQTYQKLIRSGLNQEMVVELLKGAQQVMTPDQLKKTAVVDAWVARQIMDQVRIASDRLSARYHAFLGSAGQGKTSALVKMASHMVICEKKKIAIVCADTLNVGAAEQLRIYAQILNVPFVHLRTASDWPEVGARLSHVEHVLIDYPGLNLKSVDEIDLLRSLLPQDQNRALHYVQSVLARDEAAFEVASRYQVLGMSDVIFTGLDEAAQHGLIVNFQNRFHVPLHSFGIGRQIPEDFEAATKERVVDLIFKLTKIRKEGGL